MDLESQRVAEMPGAERYHGQIHVTKDIEQWSVGGRRPSDSDSTKDFVMNSSVIRTERL